MNFLFLQVKHENIMAFCGVMKRERRGLDGEAQKNFGSEKFSWDKFQNGSQQLVFCLWTFVYVNMVLVACTKHKNVLVRLCIMETL